MDLANAFEQGIIPGIVVAIYLIVVKIIDSKKKNPLNEIARLLELVTKDIIDRDKEKAKQTVSIAFNSIIKDLSYYVTSTVISNNVSVKKTIIEDNAKNLVSEAYYNVYSSLSMYKIGDKYLNEYMKEKWKEDLYKDMVDCIFNEQLTPNDRIITFNSRIEIRVKGFRAYVINNAF